MIIIFITLSIFGNHQFVITGSNKGRKNIPVHLSATKLTTSGTSSTAASRQESTREEDDHNRHHHNSEGEEEEHTLNSSSREEQDLTASASDHGKHIISKSCKLSGDPLRKDKKKKKKSKFSILHNKKNHNHKRLDNKIKTRRNSNTSFKSKKSRSREGWSCFESSREFLSRFLLWCHQKKNRNHEDEEGQELTEDIDSAAALKSSESNFVQNDKANTSTQHLNPQFIPKKQQQQQGESKHQVLLVNKKNPGLTESIVILEQKVTRKPSSKLESFDEEPENLPESPPSLIPLRSPLLQDSSDHHLRRQTDPSCHSFPPTSSTAQSASSPSVNPGNRTSSLRRRKISACTSAKLNLETPILKVIHLLSDAQPSCPQPVMEVIEEALEILRSPDLYTPPVPTSHSSSYDRHSISYSSNTLPLTSTCEIHGPNGSSSSSSISTVKGSSNKTRQESDADEITTDLFTGLIHSNKPISGIRRMSYEAAVANRQSFSSLRDFSPISTTSSSVCSSSVICQQQQPQAIIPSVSNVPDNIKEILDSQLTWDFDIIRLEQITVKKPLVWLGLSILSHYNVCSTLNCDEGTLRNWLNLIEANYRNNPYHNSTHAADVMQATAYYLTKPRLETIFDPLDEAIALIAAICHDLDHPGKTSAFLCNSGSELAILYNDISVLESHHAALTFKLTLSDPKVNILKNLDKETFKEVRHSIIDMILATEMTKHFEHLTKFVNVFNKSLSIDEGKEGEGSCVSESSCKSRESPSAREARIRSSSLASPENVVLVKRILIKCADVSNPTRPLHLCVSWGHRIAEEYCNQTDEEKAQGLPVVMPVFDRSTCSIPKSQVSLLIYRSIFSILSVTPGLLQVIYYHHMSFFSCSLP